MRNAWAVATERREGSPSPTIRGHQIKMINGISFTLIKLITQTQLPPCPLRPGLGNSTEAHSRTVLCWGGMQLVASENGSHQGGLAGHCCSLFPHTDLQLAFTQPSPSREAQCSPLHNVHGIGHSGLGHSVARLGHGSATRHWWHSGCILIHC